MGRVWTIEERQKQAERIRSQKPWLKSTGPRTTRGKVASSHNAIKHGGYSTEFKMICKYLKLQKHYIDTLRILNKYELFVEENAFEISGNELNENATKSIQNDTNWCDKNGDIITLLHPLTHSSNDNDHQKTHPFGWALNLGDNSNPKDKATTKQIALDRNLPLPIQVAGGQSP